MKLAPVIQPETHDYRHLTAAQLRELLAQKDASLAESAETLAQTVAQKNAVIENQVLTIQLLNELLLLAKIHRFMAKSEKLAFQLDLFDEAELEAAIEDLTDQLPEEMLPAKLRPKKRNRSFAPELPRHRVELTLSEEEKAGATHTFFTKIKEELDYIPAQMRVLEYWQEKAVFGAQADTSVEAPVDEAPVDEVPTDEVPTDEVPTDEVPTDEVPVGEVPVGEVPADESVEAPVAKPAGTQDKTDPTLIAAARPVHPLGKCQASVTLLTQIIISKYADGLPLYRQESIFKRHGADVSRTNMATWIIRLADTFKPLINLMREVQNSGDYLQGDETRIKVLKEDGKTAQSQKWMWVVRGGPPGTPSVLFEYDPSRAGHVPKRLLDDFHGIFQTDGYSGYAAVCLQNDITRIGCWDHARRKFVEAVKATDTKNSTGKPTKADVAIGKIRKLYHIESKIKDLSVPEKYQIRQKLSVPALNDLKAWLDHNASKVMKGSLTRKAMDYCLNQWAFLIGYCQRGDLNISNVLVENAIRPFAVGRKAWLFADTSRGASASASLYSLIETAKANDLEPFAYLQYLLKHVGSAQTLEQWEALLPWNVPLPKISKKVSPFTSGE